MKSWIWNFIVVNVEFESILSCVESKSVDVGVAAITVTDERKEKVAFSGQLRKIQSGYYYQIIRTAPAGWRVLVFEIMDFPPDKDTYSII